MTAARLGKQNFGAIVLMEFPELKKNGFQEWDDLEQLPMAESVRLAEQSANNGNGDTAKKCVRIAASLLCHFNAKLKNAVDLSCLEDLQRRGEVHDQLRDRMSPALRQGCDDASSFLEKLLGKRSS